MDFEMWYVGDLINPPVILYEMRIYCIIRYSVYVIIKTILLV